MSDEAARMLEILERISENVERLIERVEKLDDVATNGRVCPKCRGAGGWEGYGMEWGRCGECEGKGRLR